MHFRGLVIRLVVVALMLLPAPWSRAQAEPPSEKLLIIAKSVSTWSHGDADVALLEGPVTIELDRATLSAKQAVVWIAPDPGSRIGANRVQVALIGDARVRQGGATRSGDRIAVTAAVAGQIQLRADERVARDASDSPLFRDGAAMVGRGPAPAPVEPAPGQPTPVQPVPVPTATAPSPVPADAGAPAGVRPATRAGASTTGPTTAPTTQLTAPVIFAAPQVEIIDTPEEKVAVVLTQGATLAQRRPNGDIIELRAQRVVLFTPLKSLRELQKQQQIERIQDAITAAYLEGDVRITYTPESQPMAEQRLAADRVYYEFTTDRAVLTNAVLHTVQPEAQIPVIVRAQTIRQLAQGEYKAEDVQLTTSAFKVPSYSINADRIYVRRAEGRVAGEPARWEFESKNSTFRAFGVPVFWLPSSGGSVTDGRTALRAVGTETSSTFGFGAFAEFGLFETLGKTPPRDLDLTYRLDYYSDRGPAGGINGKYQGGFLTETSREPWNFEGQFKSYFVYDEGDDDVGRPIFTTREDPEFRGRAQWEHQHFFPDNWQVQLRAGWVSDQMFLEQWFPREFDTRLPHNVSAYIKRQEDNEAFTLLAEFQPSSVVTTSDMLQEQFEVERLPEIGYRRIGQSLADRFTFTSINTAAGLSFQETRYSLQEQQFSPPGITPGIPSLGTTGVTDDTIYRFDSRQEFTMPIQAGRFKVLPYLVGRYTAYTDSPDEGDVHRLFAGVGARVTTSFWKVDDTVKSELFDLHRLRHIVEPELHVFTSGQTEDRSDVFIFDEQVDAINDVSAVQIALRQRWQTYRGGPGRWRSVDFFTLNLEAAFFANQPSAQQLRPVGFRGLFYPTHIEASVPRSYIGGDAAWRIADTTVLLADAQWNADEERLATAAIGLVAQRGEHMAYYIGNRYIADLDSNITTISFDYEVSKKYTIFFTQSFDFGLGENVVSQGGVIRRFDTFNIIIKAFVNETTDQSGIGLSIAPRGMGYGLDSDTLSSALSEQRR